MVCDCHIFSTDAACIGMCENTIAGKILLLMRHLKLIHCNSYDIGVLSQLRYFSIYKHYRQLENLRHNEYDFSIQAGLADSSPCSEGNTPSRLCLSAVLSTGLEHCMAIVTLNLPSESAAASVLLMRSCIWLCLKDYELEKNLSKLNVCHTKTHNYWWPLLAQTILIFMLHKRAWLERKQKWSLGCL